MLNAVYIVYPILCFTRAHIFHKKITGILVIENNPSEKQQTIKQMIVRGVLV